MEFIIIGVVTAVNMIVIIMKLKRGRIEDAVFDAGLLALVAIMFSGSFGGMVVSMIASMIISIYLFANPPKFLSGIIDTPEALMLKDEFLAAKNQASKEFTAALERRRAERLKSQQNTADKLKDIVL